MEISFERAKEIATESAREAFAQLLTVKNKEILSRNFLEAEHCWLFFKNEEIFVPVELSLSLSWSYAVSKKGHVRQFYTFENIEEMKAALENLSQHFAERNL